MNKSRRSRLSKSSRVSEKVMEYYMKYGKDRELEKFMRFRSPGGSQKSSTSTTTNSSTSIEDWAKVGNLECLFHEREVSSDERRVTTNDDVPTKNKSSDKTEYYVPIQIETDDKAVDKDEEPKQSAPSPRTPARKKEIDTKQTQTPESTAKSHRRLEWDSLGDVGYKKSKSTSNVSIVERMLLREFFEVSTNAPPKNTNSSESDIRLLEREIAELGTLKKHFSKKTLTMEESNYATPPLACSTRVEGLGNVKKKPAANSKMHTVGTNTSTLLEKFEKYAQTSIRKPEMTSQEVQVTLTPPGISPLLGSSAEPSSFEYRSRILTNSSEPKSTHSSSKQVERPSAGEVHPNANEINEMLQRRALGTNNNGNAEADVCERLKNLFISWNNAMEENKENASSSSSCSTGSSTPQIDLGIQLICGIMKAKNIDQKQRKRLVRNIVKRITKIANSCELDAIVSKTATLIESNIDSIVENNELRRATETKRTTDKAQVPVSKPSTSKGVERKKIYSQPNTKDHSSMSAHQPNVQPNLRKANTKNIKVDSSPNKKVESRSTNLTGSTIDPHSTISTKNSTNKTHSFKSSPVAVAKPVNTQQKTKAPQKPPNTSTTITAKTSTSSSSSNDFPTPQQQLDISLCVCNTVSGGKLISAFITQPDVKDSSSATKSETTTSSSSSSRNLPTQKATAEIPAREQNLINTAMREWLEPMTQSEVEYENKKRLLKNNKKEHRQFSSARSGKDVELNWIDSEIERLQNIKQTLLKNRSTIPTATETTPQSNQEHKTPAESNEKLYDTVYSDNAEAGSHMTSPVKQGVPTRSEQKGSISESRTSKGIDDKGVSKPKKPSEPHNRQKDTQQHEQFAPPQRSKIDTPTDTIGSESVGSFVRQRKQEFLDHYKSQKLNHYDQMMHKYNEHPSTSKNAVATSHYLGDIGGHYSVPIPIQYQQQPTSYYTYPPMQQYREPCYYAQTLAPAEKAPKRVSSDMPTKTTHASSSELSVPMGSYNTNSTATTTHQYDIATTTGAVTQKANIGSQTGHSLMHSRPIYETRCISPCQAGTMVPCTNYVACTCRVISRSACIQARPKGIAYSLQFTTKPKSKPNEDAHGNIINSEEYKTLDKAAAPSLQAALKRGNPKFLAHAKKRKSILNRIQKLRQEREHELREIADENTSLNSLDRKLEHLPPPVIERLRIFPTKQMKAMTSKHVARLPEVLASEERARDQRFKRSNRLLREIYNRRLRERVRGGKLTLNHSLTLI